MKPRSLGPSRWLLPVIGLLVVWQPALLAEVVLSLSDSSGLAAGGENSTIVRAAGLIKKGGVEEARAVASEYAAANPNSASPEILIASAWVRLGQHDQAIREIETLGRRSEPGSRYECCVAHARMAAIQQRWHDSWAHARLAELAEMPKRWSDIQRSRSQTQLQRFLAELALQRGWWKKARERLESIVEQSPDDPDIQRGIAIALFREGDTQGAQQRLRQASERLSGAPPYQLEMARLFQEDGDDPAAEKWFKQAVDVDRNAATEAYVTWLIDHNRPDDAMKQIEESDDASRESKRLQFLQALVHRMRGTTFRG